MSDDIKTLTETILKTKILEAFNDGPKFVESLIVAALDQRVDTYGKPIEKGTWQYEKSTPILDQIVGAKIRDLVQKVVSEVISEREETLKVLIRARLTDDMVLDPIVKNLLDTAKEAWRINVQIGEKK